MKMDLNNKRITVGIPTFNEEKNILVFFESLKKQSLYSNTIEKILFVDDSEDDTPQLIEKIKIDNPELNIELIHNDKRMGASNAWNTIIKRSIGEIIILLDADIILDKNCIYQLSNNVNDKVGLCASNTQPIIISKNIFSKASAFIAFWLRSVRLHGISQYTTMGRALALYLKDVQDLEIPNNIIAIDLYLQCKILEKQKDIFYCDDAIIYFQTPLTSSDFISQVTRSIIGHDQIKGYVKKFSFNLNFTTLLSEFIKNSIRHPEYSLALICCYSLLPYTFFKSKKRVSYLWETAKSTKK
jgi:glycosyltransferase involved in cell wall biosynthesis